MPGSGHRAPWPDSPSIEAKGEGLWNPATGVGMVGSRRAVSRLSWREPGKVAETNYLFGD